MAPNSYSGPFRILFRLVRALGFPQIQCQKIVPPSLGSSAQRHTSPLQNWFPLQPLSSLFQPMSASAALCT